MSLPAGLALRAAEHGDIAQLEALIPRSAHVLQALWYTREQIDGALGTVFAVDRQLIDDRTYFVIARDAAIVGCGGWSRRKTLFGGDRGRVAAEDTLLDPAREPARIRAFFIDPSYARQRLGSVLLERCEGAAGDAGFRALELVATLAGVPLYAHAGFCEVERFDIALANGLTMPAVRMRKSLAQSAPAFARMKT
jgi:GNAT superfamily N-acetyltransferase